ncbi:MAG: hypothetical protein U0414_18060 [Polyangiaceae bacterium]
MSATNLLEALRIVLGDVDPSTVVFAADVRAAGCEVRGVLDDWIRALSDVVRDAGALTNSREPLAIELTASDAHVVVLVRDSGRAIACSSFDPLAEDPSLDRLRAVVHAARGTVSVEHAPRAAGCTVRVTVPVAQPREASAVQAA